MRGRRKNPENGELAFSAVTHGSFLRARQLANGSPNGSVNCQFAFFRTPSLGKSKQALRSPNGSVNRQFAFFRTPSLGKPLQPQPSAHSTSRSANCLLTKNRPLSSTGYHPIGSAPPKSS